MISCTGLTKTYTVGESRVHALQGVDLQVEDGEFIAIVGASGSGKSTLLHLIGGIDRPTSGRVRISDIEITTLSDDELAELRARKVGFVFQFHNLIPTLTALENVELPMIFTGIKPAERRRRAEELLRSVGLENRLNHTPLQLSGGQQQRVAIARALANKPDVILADEPTGELDSKTGKSVMQTLKNIREEHGTTLVVVTHEREVAAMADRVIRLRDGRVVE